MFNLSPLDARLFAHLYLVDQPLTLDEMCEALGKSKTSMSKSARNLSEANFISPVWKKGVRKDLYEANTNLFKLFMSPHISQWLVAVKNQKEMIEDINRALEENDTYVKNDVYQSKVHEILDFHHQLEAFFQEIIDKDYINE